MHRWEAKNTENRRRKHFKFTPNLPPSPRQRAEGSEIDRMASLARKAKAVGHGAPGRLPSGSCALTMRAMATQMSRLEKLLFRMEAQVACLAWAFREIAGKPGIVFELGLGHGRTFHHLRHYLPDRDIYVFDREVASYPDCTPAPERMIVGELVRTLPDAAQRFAGQVVLAHSDIGSFSQEQNEAIARLISVHLQPALAEDALILSDLPLAIPGRRRLPLPPGAREDRYYIYR